jgi:hypothetical protein
VPLPHPFRAPIIQAQNILFAEAWHRRQQQRRRCGCKAVEKLLATFAAPLSPSKEEALQTLFSGDFNPVAWNLNLAELDDEAS